MKNLFFLSRKNGRGKSKLWKPTSCDVRTYTHTPHPGRGPPTSCHHPLVAVPGPPLPVPKPTYFWPFFFLPLSRFNKLPLLWLWKDQALPSNLFCLGQPRSHCVLSSKPLRFGVSPLFTKGGGGIGEGVRVLILTDLSYFLEFQRKGRRKDRKQSEEPEAC